MTTHHSLPNDARTAAAQRAGQGSVARGESVPEYAPTLAALHDAHADELSAIVRKLEIERGSVALDLACGDGAYTAWLAEMVGDEGLVIGLDKNGAYLEQARARLSRMSLLGRTKLVRGDASSIPLGNGAVDFALSAQSLYSLREPNVLLEEALRVLRPGGRIALLENDMLHHVVLSWPPEVDVVLQRLIVESVSREKNPERFYARYLSELLERSGFVVEQPTSHAASRRGPLGLAERIYLDGYLADLAERISPHASPSDLEALEVVVNPSARDRFLRSDLTVIYLYVLAHGIRPAD